MRLPIAPPVVATLALLATLPAQAFQAPDDGVDHGYEPVRVQTFDTETQRTLKASAAWRDFTVTEGSGWIARFDERTGAPLRAYGRGLDVGPVQTEADAISALRGFLGRHSQAFAVSPKALGTGTASYSPVTSTWYIDLPAVHDGAPVWRGGVTGRIKHGKLVMIGVEAYADTPRVGQVLLSEEAAVATAIDLGPAPDARHTDTSAELVWLPWEDASGMRLVRTWKVRSETASPVGQWVHFVDAETGELLGHFNEVRFIDGTVEARVHERRADGPLVTRPVRDAWVEADGLRTSTDADGRYTITGTDGDLSLRGPDLRMRDGARGGATPELPITGDLLLTRDSVTQPALNTWVAVQDTQAFMGRVAPDVEVDNGSGGALVANVNDGSGSCNAFYNGSINFFTAGGGCNNTGLIADVIYHEWGHGFHAFSLRAGSFDGSLSEGAADTIAFLQTDDNIIAPSFRTDGGGIRNVEPNRRYPENYDTRQAVHTNGLIFGGAMWDLVRVLQRDRYTREGANEVVAGLLAGALKGGPGIATVGEEVLLADDDDGDLSNGTPHYCEILEAFEPHGLVPELALESLVEHEQLVEADPGELTLVATGSELDLACVDVSEVEVVYKVGDGDWQRQPMAPSGADVQATLSGIPYGAFVDYYLDAGGAQVPGGGVTNPLSLYAGGVLDVWSTDFEADDGGFTSELLSVDDGTAGANDWQWGVPNAQPVNGRGGTTASGDPGTAWSGDNVWGNDLGNVLEDADGNPQYWNGLYQPERQNRLTSPVIDVPPHLEGVFLRYARWLNVEDGYFDHARILADGEIVWSNYNSKSDAGGEHHQDGRWVLHSVDLQGAADDGQVQLAWEIDTDQGLNLAGWTLDDVGVYAPATPNNRLAITDLVAGDDEDGGVTVTWTNPQYAPLQGVILVRKEGELPTGPDDGEVIFVDEDPELGAANSFFDETGRNGRTYWYAAYGDDGADTLGWTEPGWNADEGSGTGQPGGIAGCSCSTPPSTGHLAWLGLGGLLVFLRRRRRD